MVAPTPRRTESHFTGADGLLLHADRLPAERPLHVSTRRLRGRPGLGALQHACEIHEDRGALLAEARIMVASAGGSAVSPGDGT